MKILMLNYEFPPIGGGAGQAHAALCREFTRMADLRVDVVTSGTVPGLEKDVWSEHVVIHRVGIRKADPQRWQRREVLTWLARAKEPYRRLLQAGAHDLVHAFFAFPSGWLCYRTRRHCPYLISLRGSDVPGQNARLQLEYKVLGPLVFKPIWRNALGIVACSEGLKQRALRFMPEASIHVIPNGVDLERFRPAPPRQEPGPLRLLTVGRLSETKRVHLLIDTVAALHRQDCHVQLTVVGGGGLHESLQQQVHRLGLDQQVSFKGPCERETMPDLYRSHDLYVSATMQEGMSNAMLEAMASGLPIVTTPCEGLEELIQANGRVVKPTHLTEAVAALAGDPLLRGRMALAARARAETFTWQAAATAYRAVYHSHVSREGA